MRLRVGYHLQLNNSTVSYHLEESEIGDHDIVEVNFWISPRVVEMGHRQADGFVGNQRRIDQPVIFVDTTGKATAEQVDSHDAEDEPEDEADEKYVQDRWNRLD